MKQKKENKGLALWLDADRVEAGCDEAGRGCLAGPVVAAAVILDPARPIAGLNDSKQLSAARRAALREVIERDALAWCVASADEREIDTINILNASIAAMHRAVDGLAVRPDHLLIDGNRFNPYPGIPHTTIIKGDGKYASIAAASILAKTHRDGMMEVLDRQFPAYGWAVNKGYPTGAHRQAIARYGITPHHRRTFRLLPEPSLFDDID